MPRRITPRHVSSLPSYTQSPQSLISLDLQAFICVRMPGPAGLKKLGCGSTNTSIYYTITHAHLTSPDITTQDPWPCDLATTYRICLSLSCGLYVHTQPRLAAWRKVDRHQPRHGRVTCQGKLQTAPGFMAGRQAAAQGGADGGK